jgi:hypothetical protein
VGLDHAVVSRQEWEGDPAWVLGAEPGQLDRTQLWLDASTLFPVRYLEPQLGRSGATSLIEGRAYDYEHFGGVPFHTRFEFYRDGELFMTEVYENVVIDEELPEGIFDPEAIARQLAGDVAS